MERSRPLSSLYNLTFKSTQSDDVLYFKFALNVIELVWEGEDESRLLEDFRQPEAVSNLRTHNLWMIQLHIQEHTTRKGWAIA